MSDEPFSISFDPQSISEIQQFYGFSTLLSDEVQQAMGEAGSLLVQSAQNNMNWVNPTGALEASIRVMNESPYEIDVGSDLVYAARREFGYVGKYDRRGRGPYSDEGAFYLTNAMQDNESQILASIEAAAERAMQRLQG